MHRWWSAWLLVAVACSGRATDPPVPVADTDTDTDADTDSDTDADTDVDTDLDPWALEPGFEASLTVERGCVGALFALDTQSTVGLTFDAWDLADSAFESQRHESTLFDLSTEDGERLEVHVGTLVGSGWCTGVAGTATVHRTYRPLRGTASLVVMPHETDARLTEARLTLRDLLLDAEELTGDFPVTMYEFRMGPLPFTGPAL